MSVVNSILDQIQLPRMVRVRQKFDETMLDDIPGEVVRQLSRTEISSQIRPGMTIAVGVGSRGIHQIDVIVRTALDYLKACGAEPFIVPAMGSHGGATAEGQREVLANYGITEGSMDVPIKSSMEVVPVGVNEDGFTVYIDKNAYEADGIIVINRFKPHPAFRGRYECGLMKMLTIGLGKQQGAQVCHTEGFPKMARNVEMFARCIIKNTNLIAGLGIIENAYDRTMELHGLTSEEILDQEPALLLKAKKNIPTVIPTRLDVLVVDQMGKNFGGDGMDANVTRRFLVPGMEPDPEGPACVVPLSLSAESHGNAMGIGAADTTTRRLFEAMDFEATYPNALTAALAGSVRIPMVLDSDKHAIQAAVRSVWGADPARLRIVRIPNTLHIEQIEVSEALLPELRDRDDIEILSEPYAWDFNASGNLF